ncbi:YwiC-like family protein [Bifidobacterium sp. 82T24]|uniref:YwiC-like family protein n=1 Tax=Bifidobacterium pluvialisilvae TaxID=2834436 RepID=UPI001C560F50|nr:YwiC-like family protein [Bifidobacterium pluvialisilvae]MBW3087678.1 YwiC-like family protein [Bifidobacterium pluvialisilvae]
MTQYTPYSPNRRPTASVPPIAGRALRRWIPDQHGAWAMVLLPAMAGMTLSGATPTQLWLLAAWLLCYFLQFSAARWVKSRFRRRYRKPMLTYGALTALVGVPFVLLHPEVLAWAPVFAVLLAVSLMASWNRRERSLWANAAAVLATATMATVMPLFGEHPTPGGTAVGFDVFGMHVPLSREGCYAAAIFAFTQFGSVLFVKTMIRERGKSSYLRASVIWNVVLTCLGFAAQPTLGAGGATLVARSVVLPLLARNRTIGPMVTGLVECATSLMVFASVVYAVPRIGW